MSIKRCCRNCLHSSNESDFVYYCCVARGYVAGCGCCNSFSYKA